MRKIIDRLIKRLFPPKPPATVQSLVFNVPLSQIEQWTEDTLKDWLRITGTPESKIKEKALDICVLLAKANKELKEPRRVWNKFTVGTCLTPEELSEQQDAICDLLGFGDEYAPCINKDGVQLMINLDSGASDIRRVRLVRQQDDSLGGKFEAYEFPVVDNQLDLDEIKAAIAKLKESEK